NTSQPLADRIRPTSLEEFIGQKHLVAPGKPLYQAIKNNAVHSMILWGPPGVGKTTLARIIAEHTGKRFVALSAVSASKDDVRKVVESSRAKDKLAPTLFDDENDTSVRRGTVMFLDEIHRFNKAQQDFLLPYVEDGTITLIGATTENPSFEVISALLSRSQVFLLEALSPEEIAEIIRRGAEELSASVSDKAFDFLAEYANGDARQALNLLEAVTHLYPDTEVTIEHLKNALQSKHLRYDKMQEEHFNTVSAFIKSMRASNVDAALYYLARMVAAGEDPKFIARRMVIFASEDIGMAQPTALVVANEVFRAVEIIGYPECQINLAHGTVYLASAPKDRASCDAFFRAMEDAQQLGNLPIPLELRNAPTKLMKEIGYGKGYEMYTDQDLLPEKLKGRKYYQRKG
ncbi:MAG TPA: replication-associated recombination protein A, partial [Phototrophicaceae bacterium]|nr:replication-associated recombination protein A [Phototrophicaceae bacterium]